MIKVWTPLLSAQLKILSILLLLSCQVIKADIAYLNEVSGQSLGNYVEYYESEEDIPLDAVMYASSTLEFNTFQDARLKTEEINNYVWLRLKANFMVSDSWFNTEWLMYFDSPRITLYEIAILYPDGSLLVDRKPEYARSLTGMQYPLLVKKFNMLPGEEIEIYLKLLPSQRLISGFYIESVEGFLESNWWLSIMHGVFFGGVFIMVLYNLFLLLSLKQVAYLYYSLYVLLAGVSFSIINGYLDAYLGLQDFPYTGKIMLASITLMLCCYLLFLDDLIKLQNKLHWWNTSKNLVLAIGLVGIVSYFSVERFSTGGRVFHFVFLSFIVVSTVPLVVLAFRKNMLALLVLVGFLFPVVCGMTSVTNSLGLTDIHPNVTFVSVECAMLFEFSILSFALAGRYKYLIRRQAELARQSYENLKESEKLKQEFLSTISHELRTPMNGVLGALELLGEPENKQEIKENVIRIEDSTDEMVSLIDTVLSFVAIENGNIQLQQEEFTLENIYSELTRQWQRQCNEKGLELILDLPAQPIMCHGDAAKLQQILKHLVANAMKFTDSGFVKVTLAVKDQSLIRYSVEDSGVGISKEKLQRIFKMFQQADGSFNRRHGGLGIGLTIAKKLAEHCGGTLTLTSEENVGTKVAVEIPVSTYPVELKQVDSEENKAAITVTNNEAIYLVVEDNKINQKVLKGMLVKQQCQVVTCENGLEAVNWCHKNKPKMIFMDCQMPIMDGFEATRQIRLIPDFADIPIIAVTANASDDDRENCFKAGMNDFLSKPINMKLITAALAKWQSNNAA